MSKLRSHALMCKYNFLVNRRNYIKGVTFACVLRGFDHIGYCTEDHNIMAY